MDHTLSQARELARVIEALVPEAAGRLDSASQLHLSDWDTLREGAEATSPAVAELVSTLRVNWEAMAPEERVAALIALAMAFRK